MARNINSSRQSNNNKSNNIFSRGYSREIFFSLKTIDVRNKTEKNPSNTREVQRTLIITTPSKIEPDL